MMLLNHELTLFNKCYLAFNDLERYLFRKKFIAWSLFGIDESMPDLLRKHILLTNRINLTLFVTTTPYIFLFYFLGLKLHAFLLVPVLLLLGLCFFLTTQGANLTSRSLLILVINLTLGLYSVLLTKPSGMHYLFFVFSATPLLIFDLRKYVPIAISVLCSVLFFLTIEFEWIPTTFTIEEKPLIILRLSLTIVTFIWLMLLFVYLVNANDTSEEKLRHYNIQLKLKNKELEQFTYVASHDLQEPLRTITSYAELLKRQYLGSLDENGKKYLEYVFSSSIRMKKLIKDLLDHSRIGRTHLPEQIDCNSLLQEVLTDMALTISESNAQIDIQKLPVIMAFPTDLKLLFQNLLTNAIKFRKPNVTPQISIRANVNSKGCTFEIEDNGIGIEKKFQENIFAIFNRLHTRTEYEGNGIGLAHCKKIAELHGGTIGVQSKVSVGSKFYFTIPKQLL